AGVVVHAGDGDGGRAHGGVVRVGHRVVRALGEHPAAVLHRHFRFDGGAGVGLAGDGFHGDARTGDVPGGDGVGELCFAGGVALPDDGQIRLPDVYIVPALHRPDGEAVRG